MPYCLFILTIIFLITIWPARLQSGHYARQYQYSNITFFHKYFQLFAAINASQLAHNQSFKNLENIVISKPIRLIYEE